MNILIIGKAKTGTTVISKTIENSIAGKTEYHMEPKNIDYFNSTAFLPDRSHIVKIIYEHWNNTPSFRNDLVFNQSKLKFDRVISIVRDPRDEMISRLFYIIKPLKDSGKLNKENLKKWLEIILRKERNPSSIGFFDMANEFDCIFKAHFASNLKSFHKQSADYHKFLNKIKKANSCHILKYEDFITGNTELLESYLQLELSNNRDVGGFDRTRRTSSFNNWKEFFTQDDVKSFKQMFGSMLEDCGYADFELSPADSLNPDHYSKYVLKISELDIDPNSMDVAETDKVETYVNNYNMQFGIGAIFKDEVKYVLEWLAWHRLAGFSKFFIADNNSTDGTRQLLEALTEAKLINMLYTPPQAKAQLLAYRTILNEYGNKVDAIAFIDADEFIHADDGVKPTQHLASLFADTNVAAIGLNWRIFGSSGKMEQESGLVIERFLKCAANEHPLQLYIKSVVRPGFVNNVFVHHSVILNKFNYINNNKDSMSFLDSGQKPVKQITGLSAAISQGPLRVNRYITKSFQEFSEKKPNRASAIKGSNHNRGQQFFIKHDLNDVEFLGASLFADKVHQEIESIKATLCRETPFYKGVRGVVDKCDATSLNGWVVIDDYQAEIMIFVNGKFCAKVGAFRYRADVMNAGMSKNGFCGFQHLFSPALEIGDIVSISVYANPYQFKKNSVVIE